VFLNLSKRVVLPVSTCPIIQIIGERNLSLGNSSYTAFLFLGLITSIGP